MDIGMDKRSSELAACQRSFQLSFPAAVGTPHFRAPFEVVADKKIIYINYLSSRFYVFSVREGGF